MFGIAVVANDDVTEAINGSTTIRPVRRQVVCNARRFRVLHNAAGFGYLSQLYLNAFRGLLVEGKQKQRDHHTAAIPMTTNSAMEMIISTHYS